VLAQQYDVRVGNIYQIAKRHGWSRPGSCARGGYTTASPDVQDAIRVGYEAGHSVVVLAQTSGVAAGNIYLTARRLKWRRPDKRLRDQAAPSPKAPAPGQPQRPGAADRRTGIAPEIWVAIRAGYEAGHSVTTLARTHGMAMGRIYEKAKSQGWDQRLRLPVAPRSNKHCSMIPRSPKTSSDAGPKRRTRKPAPARLVAGDKHLNPPAAPARFQGGDTVTALVNIGDNTVDAVKPMIVSRPDWDAILADRAAALPDVQSARWDAIHQAYAEGAPIRATARAFHRDQKTIRDRIAKERWQRTV
jgi:hypothetical protein